MVGIRPATAADGHDVGNVLGSAFAADPLFNWMVGTSNGLEQRLARLFGAIVKQTLRRSDHLVFLSADATGAAVWQPIDKWKVPPVDLLRAMPAIARAMRGRLPTMMRALSAIEKQHPTEPHYYLEMLGTHRQHQSKGVGSAMMSVMLDRCDAEGVPAYLESSNPRNIPFYARHGFEVTREITVGRGAPVATAMWREPRG